MNVQRETSKVKKDIIQTYQHIPAAVTQFCCAAAVAFFKGFIKCSILQMQCTEHRYCKSNQKHSTVERPQSTVQSELLLFRTAPGIKVFSSICYWISLKWNRDTQCSLREPYGLFSLSLLCFLPVSSTDPERSVSLYRNSLDRCWLLHMGGKHTTAFIWKVSK